LEQELVATQRAAGVPICIPPGSPPISPSQLSAFQDLKLPPVEGTDDLSDVDISDPGTPLKETVSYNNSFLVSYPVGTGKGRG